MAKEHIKVIPGNLTEGKMGFGSEQLLAVAGIVVVAVPILIALMNATPTDAQSQDFEVASVKQNQISNGGISRRIIPGNLIYTNIALVEFFQLAYGISPRQLSGPDWL